MILSILINNTLLGKGNGKYEPIKNIRNKDVLILGSGPGVKET